MTIFRIFHSPVLKRRLGGISLVSLILCGCCATHGLAQRKADSADDIHVAVSAVSLRDKRIVLSKDAQKLFTPSSTAKVITLAAALHYLGPHHRFDTGLYAGKHSDSTVTDLYLKASGDPSFSALDLVKLASELKQLGVRLVKGNIFVDVSVFDDVAYGKGWMLDDMNEGYSAPISGIGVDNNRIVVGLIPGKKEGEPVSLTLFPATRYVKIQNNAVTKREAGPVLLNVEGKQGVTRDGTIVANAHLLASSSEKYDSVAVNNPPDFAGFLLSEELARQNIVFKGKILVGKVPAHAPRLTHHFSPPLSEMAIDFMKMSNNHATEMLIKSIAVKRMGEPGTFNNGLLAVRDFLKDEVKTELKNFVNADGSGLSRYNQISATHLTDVLAYMWNSFRTGPEFIASLAFFGEDGSLKSAKNEKLKGRVRAKTGSMTNLKSLAGYLKKDNGDVIAFAILTSGASANKQQVIENILTSLNAT